MSIDTWMDNEDAVFLSLIPSVCLLYALSYIIYREIETDRQTDGILLSHKKAGNYVTWNNLNETIGPYAEWNKPDREK